MRRCVGEGVVGAGEEGFELGQCICCCCGRCYIQAQRANIKSRLGLHKLFFNQAIDRNIDNKPSSFEIKGQRSREWGIWRAR